MISGLLSLAGAAILVVIDQLIKHWATAALLPVGSMDVLPGVVELRYCLNDGMAFSMLAGKQGLLIGMTSVMLLAVLIMLFVRKMPLTERAAWTLVLGGGVGNLIDRVLNGVVVDYINVLFMRFAIFNFADICVCVGVGLLMLAVLLDSFKKDKTAEPRADEDGAAWAYRSPRRQRTPGRLAGRAVPDAVPQCAAKSDRAGACDLRRRARQQKG